MTAEPERQGTLPFLVAQEDASAWEGIRCPGITPAWGQIQFLARQILLRLRVIRFRWSRPCLWVLFTGGTGTGKSTLFNALCGASLSETGVERPKTAGSIAFVHRSISVEEGFPFEAMAFRRVSVESVPVSGQSGVPGTLTLVEHDREMFRHCVIVDTPDVDSVELRNRQAVEDLYLLAHVVIFVVSQEKYADDVPYRFLARILADEKPLFLVLNKANKLETSREVFASLEAQGLALDGQRFHAFPLVSPDPALALVTMDSFRDLREIFLGVVSRGEAEKIIGEEENRAARTLCAEIRRLLSLLQGEEAAAAHWKEQLDLFFQEACRNLVEAQQQHFAEGTREALQKEIRRHFSKYDLLRTPRRVVARIVRTPLELLGLLENPSTDSHRDELMRIRRRIDLVPVKAALEKFNREVLEKLSPGDPSAPLYAGLRDPSVVLTGEEVKERVLEDQERLVQWLEETFSELAKGIPKTKEWGIYSASILWGGLILSLEAAIGGGITVLEAVLDTAIAPFVTKGAVELFAYQELQKVARELGRRYQDGLLSTLRMQRDRYAACVERLLASQEALRHLKTLERNLCSVSKAHRANGIRPEP
ncbi:MAG: GTPase domain-containing protein [Deltaproteobacteria bacterium]|nr:GTPase domain-containing protein [Deltaproteobacteria bacterium]